MTLIEQARKLRPFIEKSAAFLNDTDAMDAVELFPAWNGNGVQYTVDQRVRDGDKLYRVVQSHISQPDWSPANSPALFAEIAKPGEIDIWKQPAGKHDAYRIGDKVHYPDVNGPVYICTWDYNAYAPNVYGWELVGK